MNPATGIPHIHVGICTRPEVRFDLRGAFVSDVIPEPPEGSWRARCIDGKIVLDREGPISGSCPSIIFSPTRPGDAFILRDVTIGVQFHWERKEDQQFPGKLRLECSEGNVVASNIVDIEQYLASVISSEMSASASPALLRAHAIASRSWLLAQLADAQQRKRSQSASPPHVENATERLKWYDREDHDLFDVCADDHCQRYQGTTKATSAAVGEAVRATCGQVLTYGGGLCDARFSKCCGGVTEAFENVWAPENKPYLVPVLDEHITNAPPDLSDEAVVRGWIESRPPAYCNTRDSRFLTNVLHGYDRETGDFFRWNQSYEQDELAGIVRRRSGIDFGQMIDLIPAGRSASGRLVRLTIVGTKRKFTIGKELEIRRTLSDSHLYSAAFVVEKSGVKNGIPSRFNLRGAGWGHGVGLCQIGAAAMGEQGFPHEAILSHYFPLAGITQWYKGS